MSNSDSCPLGRAAGSLMTTKAAIRPSSKRETSLTVTIWARASSARGSGVPARAARASSMASVGLHAGEKPGERGVGHERGKAQVVVGVDAGHPLAGGRLCRRCRFLIGRGPRRCRHRRTCCRIGLPRLLPPGRAARRARRPSAARLGIPPRALLGSLPASGVACAATLAGTKATLSAATARTEIRIDKRRMACSFTLLRPAPTQRPFGRPRCRSGEAEGRNH